MTVHQIRKLKMKVVTSRMARMTSVKSWTLSPIFKIDAPVIIAVTVRNTLLKYFKMRVSQVGSSKGRKVHRTEDSTFILIPGRRLFCVMFRLGRSIGNWLSTCPSPYGLFVFQEVCLRPNYWNCCISFRGACRYCWKYQYQNWTKMMNFLEFC